MAKRYRGTVRWFSQARGYGFINGDNDRQYFLHIEAIESGDQYLDEGDRVSFAVRRPYNSTQKHWRAVDVRLIEERDVCRLVVSVPAVRSVSEMPAVVGATEDGQTTDGAPRAVGSEAVREPPVIADTGQPSSDEATITNQRRQRKKNPFDRLPTTDPSRFVGRRTEIDASVGFLAGYKSFIVSGAPGVGKSSFLNQLSQIVTRNVDALEKYGGAEVLPEEMIAVARHQCEQGNNLDHIRAGLISGLRRDYAEAGVNGWVRTGVNAVKKAARNWMFGSSTIEVEENGEDSRGEQASQNKFYQFTEQFLTQERRIGEVAGVKSPLPSVGGIIFVIDEVERLGPEVNIGSFAKTAIDHFTNRGIRTIAFVFCGTEGTATRIYADLPRARALFDHLPLPGMSDQELGDIVTKNLAEVGATIDIDAMGIIVRHANRNPARLIFLAGSCYEHDEDGVIRRGDCDRAARKLISNLVKADFRNIIERKSWESTYRIMQCVSYNEGTPLTAEIIATETGLELNSVESFCGILSSEGIFIALDNKSEDRKKKYTFRDPIFALYFKLAQEMGIRFEKEQATSGPGSEGATASVA